jgi:ComF family protein
LILPDSKPVSWKTNVPSRRQFPASPIRSAGDGILNLIFPDRCLLCGTPVSRLRDCSVCGACWDKAVNLRLQQPWCPLCGLPFQMPTQERGHLCGACSIRTPPFSGARSFGYYADQLSRLVQVFKFERRRNLAKPLAALLAASYLETWRREDVELTVPVPLHPRRRRERRFNQSALLAAALQEHLMLPYSEAPLRRTRDTLPQVGLPDAERFRNMRSAFRCEQPGMVRGKRILLVDDVMTTGATAASASEALLAAGARSVSVLTVARAVPGTE